MPWVVGEEMLYTQVHCPEQGEESPVLWKRPVFWCSGEEALFFHPQGKVKEVQFGEDTVLELMLKNPQLERGKSSW